MIGFRHATSASRVFLPGRSRMSLLGACLLGLLFLGAATSCGSDETPVTIPPFPRPAVDMVVDDVFSLAVKLNQPAPDPLTVSVSVDKAFSEAVVVDATTLNYNRGEQSQTLRVTAKAPTDGQYVHVTFTVDSNGAQQVWRVRVGEPAQ